MVATVEAMTEDIFNCHTCKTQHSHREDPEDFTIKSRKVKGCFDLTTRKYQTESIEFHTCVGNLYSASVFQMLDMMQQYQRGIMPYPGSFADQPAKLIEALQTLDGLVKAKIEKKKAEESKKNKRREKMKSRG